MFDANSNHLLQQISAQNLVNISATLKNSEQTEAMGFNVAGNTQHVKVVRIPMDGSCFFGSVVHQLYGLKVNSPENTQKTKELRAEVVLYIQKHFDKFEHDLKGRVFEHSRETINKNSIDAECRIFLNACLPLSTCYAGYESIRAISEIKKINIVTISEGGYSYMAVDFKKEFDRTILLAHRLTSTGSDLTSHNCDRQHYDHGVI